MKRKGKKLLISAVALVLVAAIGAGVWFWAGSANSEPVNVYPFHYLGMTEYWGDSQESYGFVQTDGVQTVYLTATQTVTEIFVQEGDTVKRGDVLMTFDTTLSDLALERKRLDVEKLKLQLQDAKEQLAEINSMRPMVIPQPSDDPEEEEKLGELLTDRYQLSHDTDYDGSSKDNPLICWLNTSAALDNGIFDALLLKAREYQAINAEKEAEEETQPSGEGSGETQPSGETPTEETQAPTDAPTEAPTEAPPAEDPTEGTGDSGESPEDPTQPSPGREETFFVVIKVTRNNRSLADKTLWQGLSVTRNPETGDYSFRFFDAVLIPDHMLSPDEEAGDTPQIDFGSGYTAAQIAQMRSDQEKAIKELEFNIKMAEAEYKIAQTEVADGNVYAEIDGVVVSLMNPDEALMSQQPVVKVSAGGGFYVEGTFSELDRDNLTLGQEVTINDWYTGMTYTGTIESLGDFPSAEGYWNGLGNPNASYYPFRVFVEDSADLQSGSYVSILFSAGASENGVYLQNPFLRTEGGRSYVFVLGEDGKLEKRYVTTGKSLWGSYTEILEGLTAEDYIAFPYGKNVRDGAEAVQSEDMSTLYS